MARLRILLLLALALPLVLSPTLAARASAQQADPAAAVVREIALVEFFGGGTPLAADERVAIDAAVRQAFAADPAAASAAATESAKLLALVQRQSGPRIAELRTLGRRAIAFQGMQALGSGAEGAAAAQIVDRHDPIVVADPAHQLLVTRRSVVALVDGSRTGAAIFAVPPPGPDAVPALEDRIRREWPAVDAGLRQALADAGRTMPFAAPYLAARPGPARARFVADYHRRILAAPDPEGVQFNLAEVMAFVAETGSRNQGGGSALGAMMGARDRQAAIDRAGRALMPSCGVAAGSVMSPERRSFCNP